MINAILRLALENRVLVVVAVIGLAIGGYFSFQRLAVDAFPDATPTMVQIFTSSEGLSPCLLYTSPSPRDLSTSRMPSSA